MNRQNLLQILIVVLAFGGPVIVRILSRLQVKRQQLQTASLKQKLELERLRTGRVNPKLAEQVRVAAQGPRAPSVEEIAARRRAQIEELRRRQMAASAARSRGSPRPAQQRPASVPQVRRGGPPARGPGTSPFRPRPQASGAPPTMRPAARPAPMPSGVWAPAPVRLRAPRSAQAVVKAAPAAGVEARPVLSPSAEPAKAEKAAALIGGLGAEDLRRAIVLREILGRPLCERPYDAEA